MNCLHILGTENTPEVHLSKETGTFSVSGRSVPENGDEFFAPIMEWMDEYAKAPNNITHFNFHMEYMNLSSSKMLLFILYKLKEIKDENKDVLVNWIHESEDSDMIEVGEDYEFMVDIPFKFSVYHPVTV